MKFWVAAAAAAFLAANVLLGPAAAGPWDASSPGPSAAPRRPRWWPAHDPLSTRPLATMTKMHLDRDKYGWAYPGVRAKKQLN